MEQLALFGGPKAMAVAPPKWPRVTEKDVEAVTEALRGRWCRLYPGSKVEQFEAAFAAYQQAEYAVGVCNGTAAMELALQAMGVRPGDEVLLPAVTFIGTAGAITGVGAIPVFVDSDPARIAMSAEDLERRISSRATAVMVVHYGGYPPDMDAIGEVVARHGLMLLEDCAHAHGGEWRGRRLGTFGAAGAFSFQESKSLAGGEGGMVVTNDERVAERARLLDNLGRPVGQPGYEHFVLASNYRMPELQGALLLSQFERLPETVATRQAAGRRLTEGLAEMDGLIPLPVDPRVTQRGYYFYVIRYQPEAFPGVSRDRFLQALSAEGVPCGAGYGLPLYREPAFEPRNLEPLYPPGTVLPNYQALELPVAERFCYQEQITIPHSVLVGGVPMAEAVLAAVKKVVENIGRLR